MAKVILDSGDSYIAASAVTIFGSSGAEVVKLFDGVTITADGNVDRIEFTGATSAYNFKSTATGVQVLSGTAVLANVGNGNKLSFSNGSVTVASGFDPVTGVRMTVGGVVVTATPAVLVSPSVNTSPSEVSSVPIPTAAPTAAPTTAPAAYTIDADKSTVSEGAAVTYTVTRTNTTAAETLTVYAVGDSTTVTAATYGIDFTVPSTTVSFAAGVATATFTVNASTDATVESLEGFKVSLLNGSSATVVSKITTITDTTVPASGQTFTLTTGNDASGTLVGSGGTTSTTGDDTFNATLAASGSTLNSFDNIAGGAGTDTLNIASTTASNFTLPVAVTYSGLDNVNVSQVASGGTGTGALTVIDTTFGTGVKQFSYTDASATADMTAAAVSVTLNSATAVTTKALGTGNFTTVAITDTSTTVGLYGSTLTHATVTNASGAVTLTGNAINTVDLNAVGGLTTVAATAGTRALTVNASGTTTQGGLTDAEATSAILNVSGAQTFGTLTVAKATSVTVNATAATTETIAAAAATSLTLGGTGLNTLTVTGTDPITSITVTGSGGVSSNVSGISSLTSINTSSSTATAPASGALTGANTFTIGTGVAVTGGSGQEVITVGATSKAISLGAGNDTVILGTTALASGGSINGGDGSADVLKLSNADAVSLSTAGATQTAFKAAVTGFETLDITTQTGSTVDVSGMGTFTKVQMTSASAAQVLAGVTTGTTIQSTYGVAATSITTNSLTGTNDSLTFIMTGDLSTGARVFGTLATPGVETVNLQTNDTSSTVTARLATLTLTDTNVTSLVISGNNGLALTHTGTALTNFDASGITKGGVTFTSAALTTDTVVKGSAVGGDTLDFSLSSAKATITAYAGTNTLKGSSSVASTITGGTGNDAITGGSGADAIVVGSGTTGNTITAAGGKDAIDLTNSTGSDIIRYNTIATSAEAAGAQMDTITGFKASVDKINFAQGALSLTGVTTDGTGDAVATMAAVVDNATSVADISAVYTALTAYSTLTASAAGGTATVAQVYNFTTGAAAGTYLVVNDVNTGFQAATDVVIKLVGTDGTITAADFTFTA
jgi:S-layer protein